MPSQNRDAILPELTNSGFITFVWWSAIIITILGIVIPSHQLGLTNLVTPHPLPANTIILDIENRPKKLKISKLSEEDSLSELFSRSGFKLEKIRSRETLVPKLFLWKMPSVLTKVNDTRLRKNLFIRILLPLTLRQNAKILDQRNEVIRLKTIGLSLLTDKQQLWLSNLANYYRVPAQQEGTKTISDITVSQLLQKLDIIPVSMAIAQSAIETGWGTSRFCLNGNALFGQWTWTKAGLSPRKRDPTKTHSVRRFRRLFDSVMDYSHNLNTSPFYSEFRRARLKLRLGEKFDAQSGYELARYMSAYSEEGQKYVQKLQEIITENRLVAFESLGPRFRRLE
tara:strand:+ start:2005 stop:3024 length:1020 start_codon:yes stop_codon:yes gene_type:complete